MFMPFAMLCMICRNAASNMTAYERSNRSVYPHFRGGNPFNRGFAFNLKEFFGSFRVSSVARCPVTLIPGFGSVNWRRNPLFTKQSLDNFYPAKSVEQEPLMHEDVGVLHHAAADDQLAGYLAGYPPLPSDAIGTEV